MDCSICSRSFGRSRHATCASCARAQVYSLRLDQVNSLVAKEKLQGLTAHVLQHPSRLGPLEGTAASQVVDLTESSKKLEWERNKSQIRALDTKLESVRLQQELLREQISRTREENVTRKQTLLKTRADIQAAQEKLRATRDAQLRQVEVDCKRLVHRLEKVQRYTISGRQRLCMETAYLFGLRRKKGRTVDGVTLPESFYIGKLPIQDIRELNKVDPDTINASLANVTRFLATTSHYLGLRLPAEVIPPHTGSPQPGIFSLHSSYHADIGKLRRLHITKPLPILARDDAPVYNNFLDGLILLAYDVAWLCRTQGLLEIDTWDAMCAMGSNLYKLFLQHGDATKSTPETKIVQLGEFSNANTTADAARHQVALLLDNWRLPSLASLVDRTKSHLLTEMSRAEWELLDAKEWEEEREDERAVLVGGARWSLSTGAASRMGVSYMTAAQDVEDGQGKDESGKGWMKLKVRSGETRE